MTVSLLKTMLDDADRVEQIINIMVANSEGWGAQDYQKLILSLWPHKEIVGPQSWQLVNTCIQCSILRMMEHR